MAEKLKFPIEGSDTCPCCGSEERILKRIIDQLKEEGRLTKEAYPMGVILQVQMLDPKKVMMLASPVIKVPVVLIAYDICAQCKTMYCTGVNMVEMPAQMKMMPQQPPVGTDMRGGGSASA